MSVTRPSHALAASLILLAFASPVCAQEAEDVIKYRQNVMKATGGHMASMAAIARGKVNFDEQFAAHAKAMKDLADMTGSLFPEGSDFGETDAKEAIWEEPEDFAKRVKQQQDAAVALADAAQAGDAQAVKNSFRDLGKACKACHKKYRAEKE